MSSLHFSTLPGSHRKRECLTFGYIRSQSIHNIPPEIILLCMSFYNETLQWTVDCHDLRDFVKNNPKQLYFDKYFRCNGLEMRWVINPVHSQYFNYLKVTSLHLEIPAIKNKSITNSKYFISIYCAENGASFGRCIEQDDGHLFLDEHGMSAPFRMILDHDNLDTFTIVHHVDVLQVQYTKEQPEYIKPVEMSSECSFEWKIEGILLQQMRDAVPAQMFYSDLFDGRNHNWALAAFPQGQDAENSAGKKKQNTFDLVLRLFKAAPTMKEMTVELAVKNSVDQIEIRRTLEFENKCLWDEYYSDTKMTVFPSAALTDIEEVTISVHVEVLSQTAR